MGSPHDLKMWSSVYPKSGGILPTKITHENAHFSTFWWYLEWRGRNGTQFHDQRRKIISQNVLKIPKIHLRTSPSVIKKFPTQRKSTRSENVVICIPKIWWYFRYQNYSWKCTFFHIWIILRVPWKDWYTISWQTKKNHFSKCSKDSTKSIW